MRYILRPIFLIVLFSGLFYASMTETVTEMIAKNKIDRGRVSVLIKEITTDRDLVSINPNTSRKPASVMKLLTTYSALLEFGGGFRWPTKFYYNGRYRKGVIQGDLIIKGYGDPTLSSRDLPSIVKRLRAVGIKKITGDIIIDRTFFDTPERISSGFDKNRFSEYNAMPDALMFNDHLCKVVVKPNGGRIDVRKSIDDKSYDIENRLVASSQSCKGNRSWPRVNINMDGSRSLMIFSGSISLSCSQRTIRKVVTQPYKSFYYDLKSKMVHAGIKFHGTLHLAKVPSGARPLFTHYSKPLLQIIAKTNKKSNNMYARHIMLLLGAKRYGVPATKAKGEKAIKQMLGQLNIIHSSADRIDNGCGLSRTSRLSARTLSNLLSSAQKKYNTSWRQALSIAGVDGTIKRRFAHSIAKKRAWMKTGTLNDAKNIAGYVRSKSSKKLYSLVVLYNGREKWKGSTLQNQIINWLAK
jgi:D-alanyl-D-alanine carboxypeptidase/D-alanyl-D-alanine-endopeptidase (penicillin-binding protein 4)